MQFAAIIYDAQSNSVVPPSEYIKLVIGARPGRNARVMYVTSWLRGASHGYR